MNEYFGDVLPAGMGRAGELGVSLSGARPAWQFTTVSRHVAEELVRMFDGRLVVPADEAGSCAAALEVQSEGDPMYAHVADGSHIRNRFRLGPVEAPIHVCDGEKRLPPMGDVGGYCGCPVQPHVRKAAARLEKGPKPDVRLTFQLAQAPELGYFDLHSDSWDFAASLASVRERILSGAPILLQLTIVERRLLTRAGSELKFIQPAATQSSPAGWAEFGLTA
ncbi:hypothetical protein ACN6K8_000258 [[Kitasatospora] papulosa]|uniref:hypothetical protein n=1 Tax=Streptomyces TaxID=1883 RepID=UPI003444A564